MHNLVDTFELSAYGVHIPQKKGEKSDI